ncbi:hypothetical protein AKJ08_0994 [Vulgatibacter incomptus]|uniref:Uncharacterized protein n=1 Tax=Vulgatibacter incomptus TaxID=1391653 RepID=A0A0K1PAS6_9BACT|nr:hypothetical protein AKJ08_0994 [Vulgatibacter incomptus]
MGLIIDEPSKSRSLSPSSDARKRIWFLAPLAKKPPLLRVPG